ncbi:MAG: helix-turn-helix domain-containing protein [Acidobacteriota bacterium]
MPTLTRRFLRTVQNRIQIDIDVLHRSETQPGVIAMLEEIRTGLTRPDTNVTTIRKRRNLRNNSVAIFFHIALGSPPGRYLERARLDLAVALLTTPLSIAEVAEQAGYAHPGTFARALARRFGLGPRRMRRLLTTCTYDPAEIAWYTQARIPTSHGGIARAHRAGPPIAHQLENLSHGSQTPQTRHALAFMAKLIGLVDLGLDARRVRDMLCATDDHVTITEGRISIEGEPMSARMFESNPPAARLLDVLDRHADIDKAGKLA